MTDVRAIEVLLGPVDASSGPFGVLGLPVASQPEARVRAALAERLARVDAHALSRTPDADEARLALHAAAAQLMDAEVSAALVRRARGSGDRSGGVAARGAVEPTGRSVSGLRGAEVRAALIARRLRPSGGVSRRRASLAVAHLAGAGLPAARSGAGAAAAPDAGAAGEAAGVGAGGPGVSRVVGGSAVPAWATAAVYAAAGALAALLVVVLVARSGSPGPRAGQQAGLAAPSEPVFVAPPDLSERLPEARPERGPTPGEALEALRSAIADRGAPASALAERLDGALGGVGADWLRADAPTLTALGTAIDQAVGELARRDLAAAAEVVRSIVSTAGDLPALASRGGSVAPAVWHGAVACRLSRDRSRDGLRRVVAARLGVPAEAGGSSRTIAAGARATLASLASSFAAGGGGSAELWRSWVGVARDAEGVLGESIDADGLAAGAIGALLRGGGGGGAESAEWFTAVRTLADAVDWESEGDALLAWMSDRSFATSRLATLTAHLTSGGASSSLAGMRALPAGASAGERLRVRDAYARALGLLPASASDSPASRWASRVDEVLMGAVDERGAREPLRRAAVLAWLNAAAEALWIEDGAGADRALERSAGVEGSGGKVDLVSLAKLTSPSAPPDGAWAASYLSARRDAGAKVGLLHALRNGGGPKGPADADILARAAMIGGPRSVREAAQRAADGSSGSVLVVYAALEAAPDAARRADVSVFVEGLTGRSLPPFSAAGWRVALRRALVARVLELAGAAAVPDVAALQEELEGAYASRAEVALASAGSVGSEGSVEAAGAGTIAEVAGRVHGVYRSASARFAEGPWTPTPAGTLARLHEGRLRLAVGVAQRFAAEQVGLAERFASVVAAERPARADEVRRVLAEMASSRRGAARLFEQIAATERAMAQLWRLRLDTGGLEL